MELEVRTPKNFFLIAVKKEQKLGSGILYAPIHKGEQENEFKPVSGIVVGLPDKYTKDHQIASNFKGGNLTAADLAESCRDIQVNDTVYLSYLAFDDDRIVDAGLVDDDHTLYRVPVHHLIAKKEGSKLKAIAGKVLIEPIKEDGIISKSLISTYSVKKHGHGRVVSSSSAKIPSGVMVAYMEKIAEWIEIDGVRYDFVYVEEILGII